MSARMRVVGWEVRPVVMADDGENLTPVPIGPQVIPASAWREFKDGGDTAALESIRSQVEGLPDPPASA